MAKYLLSCCSTVDLTAEHIEKIGVHYANFHYYIDNKEYTDDFGTTMPFDQFYKAMEHGADTRTSQINESEFINYFTNLLAEYPEEDILHVSFSSGLSGSYGCALSASKKVMESMPERKVIVVDSLAASSGYGLMMDKCAELRDQGMDIDTLAQWIIDNRLRLHHWFFSTDLKFYIKGGRVSKTSGFVAGILGICPLLNVNEEGKLIPREKILSKRRVKEAIVKKVALYIDDGENYSDKIYICNSACIEDATDVKNELDKTYSKKNGDVQIFSIGTVIGSHTGPGTVAVFFWGKDRTTIL